MHRLIAVLCLLPASALAEAHGLPVLVSTHPRTRARLEKLDGLTVDQGVRFEKPFGFFDYIHLQQQAACVLSDSGTITEESAILGFPAVTIRDTHERPEGMDAGVLAMCGLGRDTVLPAVTMTMAAAAARGEAMLADDDFYAMQQWRVRR